MNKGKRIDDLRDFLASIDGKNGISILGYVPLAEALYEEGCRLQSEWISVDERLPEPKTDVLVAFVDGGITVDFRMPGYGFMYGKEVTHWMPLPEPPKMRNEDENGTVLCG